MDARWRDHLSEMDNLKDGIHLRWTVQADPLNAWQQEGYSMFGQLLEVIDNDYLRYILHVEAVQTAASAEPDLDKAVYAAAEDPVAETASLAGALAAERGAQVPSQSTLLSPAEAMAAQAAQAQVAQADGAGAAAGNGSGNGRERQRQRGAKAQIKRPNAPDPDAARPVVKAQTEKVGRNEPCWCGSGKKFKFCHGAG
jgi:preprotein translocase subunit SecA